MGRVLGRSGIEVSEVGFGCWAIGGPAIADGMPDGWGDVDDEESVAALRRGLELGVTFFDTADVYGAGHSEQVLGRALEVAGTLDGLAAGEVLHPRLGGAHVVGGQLSSGPVLAGEQAHR